MSLVFWLIVTPISLWFVVCAAIWIWYYFWGQHQNTSGDVGLIVLLIPILPFIYLYHKMMECLRK